MRPKRFYHQKQEAEAGASHRPFDNIAFGFKSRNFQFYFIKPVIRIREHCGGGLSLTREGSR